MRRMFKKLVPFIIILSMVLTTGAQSVNIDKDDIEKGANEQEEKITLEEVEEVEEVEELGEPSLKLKVDMKGKSYKNGDTIEYEIRLTNDGEVDLEGIKVEEDLNEDVQINKLKVKEEKILERSYKIGEDNKLEEIKNKVEAEVKFDGKSLGYKEEFKVEVIKEEEEPEEPEEAREEPKDESDEGLEAKEEPKKDLVEKEQEKEEKDEVGKESEETEENDQEIEETEEDEYKFEKELEPNREIGSDGPRIAIPSYLYQTSNKIGTFSLTDTIAVNKTARRSPGCRTFEVTLDITGTPQEAPVDVVLVIDRSGSMGFSAGGTYWNPLSRLYYAKQAAINFAGRVLGPNGIPGSRVSVVSFSGPTSTSEYGNQNQASTDLNLSTNLTSVTNTINGISAGGGTNTEAGFIQGQTVIQGATSNQNPNSNKVVIMLTDGLPTASNGNRYEDTTDINDVHIQSAITAGKNIHQNNIAGVFTIGLTTGMNATEKNLADNILDQAQNKGYYPAPSATDLDAIFDEISQSLGYAATNAKVVDKIGNNFNLVESSLPSEATYDSNTREITWNPGTIVEEAQLKYIVQAKSSFPGGLADTNEFAELTYKDIFGTAGQTKTFPVPEVTVPTLIEVSLTDATITSGDSINLGSGTDPSGQNYMSPVTGGDNDGINFTYEWKEVGDSTVISTDKNPSVSPTEDTEYEVTVTDSNGCKATATMWVRVTKLVDITISKIVTGNMGDLDKEFQFKATLTDGNTNIDFNPGQPAGVNINGNEATFTLKHGEEVTLIDIPVGSKITVTETDNAGYTVSYTVDGGTSVVGSIAEIENIQFSEDGTLIEFTNKKDTIIDTGISLDNLPYMILILISGVGILGAFIWRRKYKIE